MRYLLISTIFFLIISCKVTTVKDYVKSDTITNTIHNPYFADKIKDYVYTANIKVYNNEFSGILIVKKLEENEHRMVFTSQFGSTFFDIAFKNDTYKIHTIVKELDRKIILNILLRDFSILVKENTTVVESYSHDVFNILKGTINNRSNYYFYSQEDQELKKIVHTKKVKEKFEIHFSKISENKVAKQINIDHKDIKLHIELNLLKE